MATPEPYYYDPWGSGTTPNTSGGLTDTTDTSGWGYCSPTRGFGYSPTPTYRTVTRKILVRSPENWTKEQTLKFSTLVNKEIDTGWKVTLIISGEIVITDPDVEKRTMEDFIPLLKDTATKRDIHKIECFFIQNKIKSD